MTKSFDELRLDPQVLENRRAEFRRLSANWETSDLSAVPDVPHTWAFLYRQLAKIMSVFRTRDHHTPPKQERSTHREPGRGSDRAVGIGSRESLHSATDETEAMIHQIVRALMDLHTSNWLEAVSEVHFRVNQIVEGMHEQLTLPWIERQSSTFHVLWLGEAESDLSVEWERRIRAQEAELVRLYREVVEMEELVDVPIDEFERGMMDAWAMIAAGKEHDMASESRMRVVADIPRRWNVRMEVVPSVLEEPLVRLGQSIFVTPRYIVGVPQEGKRRGHSFNPEG